MNRDYPILITSDSDVSFESFDYFIFKVLKRPTDHTKFL